MSLSFTWVDEADGLNDLYLKFIWYQMIAEEPPLFLFKQIFIYLFLLENDHYQQ